MVAVPVETPILMVLPASSLGAGAASSAALGAALSGAGVFAGASGAELPQAASASVIARRQNQC